MSNMYCMISDFMTTEQGWQLQSLTGVNNELDMGTLTFQKLLVSQPTLSTLVIDFRGDSSNIFVEATGQNHDGIHEAVAAFFEKKLGATNARNAADDGFAPVKYAITDLVKHSFKTMSNNMSNIYCLISDFMTTEQGWQLKSITGTSSGKRGSTLTFQKLPDSQPALSTLIIDFTRGDAFKRVVEATGQDFNGIHGALKKFLEELGATDARDATEDFAPVKYNITHLVKITSPRTKNNMPILSSKISDFMTEQGWRLQSLTGIGDTTLATLTFQSIKGDTE
eukprot:TRINITY_DN11422_c0_g2_i1.p1 TRINITY_DN11422_c0_g2~~TRINITY_DN11422_c0_g2_i1.p1  ORF type:complete len:281 (-),score=44.61 TRINITY_DN11422_c0_g2_i1:282-1124(-)